MNTKTYHNVKKQSVKSAHTLPSSDLTPSIVRFKNFLYLCSR